MLRLDELTVHYLMEQHLKISVRFITKLKCSTSTESESCRSDDYFWLYNENIGEKGNCKEKDDNLLIYSDVKKIK
jgi:hypothetical protein